MVGNRDGFVKNTDINGHLMKNGFLKNHTLGCNTCCTIRQKFSSLQGSFSSFRGTRLYRQTGLCCPLQLNNLVWPVCKSSVSSKGHIKLGRRHRSDFNAAFSHSYLCDVISLFMSFCCARQLLRTPHVHAHPSVWVGSHLHKSKYFGKIFLYSVGIIYEMPS